jgi:hypothetical protein
MPLTTYTAGEVLTAASLNANLVFAAANPTAPATAIFNETQASGTAGGAAVTGSFQKRVLNTTVVNNITGCSIASSVITLPAGTFVITANSPHFVPQFAKIILRNTTASTNAIIGMSCYSNVGDAVTVALLTGTVTTTAATTFELQYQVTGSTVGQSLGVQSSFGVSEIYATIQITMVA